MLAVCFRTATDLLREPALTVPVVVLRALTKRLTTARICAEVRRSALRYAVPDHNTAMCSLDRPSEDQRIAEATEALDGCALQQNSPLQKGN